MVKDKHVKALDFMVNMKFSDSCIGFAAETKQFCCHAQFPGNEITRSDAIHFLSAFPVVYGMALQMMMRRR